MSWNAAVFNKLHSIKPSLSKWQPSCRVDRKEVTLTRLRIGHTFITHSFLLKGEDWPLSIPCQETFSVKHFLLDCTDFRGWSGAAMVLGKLPVPRRPTNLD